MANIKVTRSEIVTVRDEAAGRGNQGMVDACNTCLWYCDQHGDMDTLTVTADRVRAAVIARADAVAQGRI